MPDNNHSQLLLQLHIAEYNALTNRNTYYVVIASSLLVAFVLFATLIAPLFASPNVNRAVIVWICAIVGQALILGWIENTWQQFNTIRYLEHHLRPLILAVLGSGAPFWQYETYMSEQRAGTPQWLERGYVWVAAALLILIAASRVCGWFGLSDVHAAKIQWPEWTLVALNVLCIILVVRNTARLTTLRRSMFPDQG